MTTLVTGASGFIGRHLINKLLEIGTRIKIVTRFADQLPVEWAGLLEVVEGDLRDEHVAQEAIRNVSLIYHLAGERRDSAQMHSVNVEAVSRLLNAAKRFTS